MSSRVLLACLCLFCWASIACLASTPTTLTPLDVTAHFEQHGGKPALAFRLENRSQKSLSLREPDLPWGNRYSVIVLAVDRKTGDPLKGVSPIDDSFVYPVVEIAPGKALVGYVDLPEHIDGLTRTLATRDVILFWYYQARGKDNDSLGEYGGWLTLKRHTK
jgi:hypothetical protein